MICKIIEDHSPYYITFTFENLNSIIEYMNSQTPSKVEMSKNFGVTPINYEYWIYQKETSKHLHEMLPFINLFNFNKNFLLSVNTLPGGGGAVHKDIDQYRRYARFSINLPLRIDDDRCFTHWYSDDTFKDYPDMTGKWRHAYSDFRKLDQFPSLKTATFKRNEAVIINADIWHAWDNTKSPNYRTLLSLRVDNPGDLYFNDATRILF